jgi:excisionase family DNA binding protein
VSTETSREVSHLGTAAPQTARSSERIDRCFTIDEVAHILRTSPATIRRLIKDNRIGHQRVSARRTVISESVLRAYIDSVTAEARP